MQARGKGEIEMQIKRNVGTADRLIRAFVVAPVALVLAALVGVKARLGGLRDPDAVVPPDLASRIQARLENPGGPGARPSG
jgi:hypothetical protein